MKRPSLLYSFPILLMAACRIDSAEGGSGPPDDPDFARDGMEFSVSVPTDGSAAAEPECETNADCEDAEGGPICFDEECVPCSPQTNAGCIQGEYCSPTRLECFPGCDDVFDCGGFLCVDGECTDYIETTPICNYLERGIDDFQGGSDQYSLAPVNVRTLADLDRLAFGLDIPRHRCLDPNPSFPCTDKDINDDWCISGIELTALGFTLFSAEPSPTTGCVLMVQGGLSGVKEITGDELRSNPSWGFDIDDLLQLFEYVTFDDEGNMGVVPNGYELPATQVARLIEGMIGIETAAYNKGKANKTYNDNRRGMTVFFSQKKYVNCDFGNCPSPDERHPSPWVELKKTDTGSIAVDIDLEFINNTYDPGDCIQNPDINEGGWHCGNLGTSLGYGSLGFELDVVCKEMNDGSYGIQVEVSEPTFQPEGGVMKYGKELCGFIASTFGGSLVGIIGYETWCKDKANELDPANIFAEKLGDSFSQNLLRNLDSCPEIGIGDDGSIRFDTNDTINCTDPDCLGLPARLAPDVTFAYDATSATIPTDQFLKVITDIAPPPPEPLAGKEFSVETIDDGMGALCAIQATCDMDGLNFKLVDFSLLGKILQQLPEGEPPDTANIGDLIAWLGQDVYQLLQEFAKQDEIQKHCVDHSSNNAELATAMWLKDVWDAMSGEKCSNLPSFESLFPTSLIDIRITSGPNVTDNYPFVDFSDPGRKNWRALEGSACHHLYDKAYEPAPPSWQNCPDFTDPAYFGHRGCPCANVDTFTIDDILVDGGRSDGPGSYRVHGQNGPGQFCDDNTATAGNEVVCGLSQKHHAECQECGLDTNLGCSCLQDSDCEGIEPNLTCIGDAGDGWGPGAQGTCLPDISATNAAFEALAEMPWFCLESCGAIAAAGQMGCLYDQEDNVTLPHARCVNVDAMSYDPQAWATCAESGMFWEDDNVCAMECTSTAECAWRGFPADFVCDFEFGWSPGRCVPEGCQSMNVADAVFGFCQLYR